MTYTDVTNDMTNDNGN